MWPGVNCELMGTADNGNKIWKWVYDGDWSADNMPAYIIFNNTSSPQTKDLPFSNGGYYTVGGLQYTVEPVVSGVAGVDADGMKVYSYGGSIIIESAKPRTVWIYGIDGVGFPQQVDAGRNVVSGLSHGVYIVEGKKLIL